MKKIQQFSILLLTIFTLSACVQTTVISQLPPNLTKQSTNNSTGLLIGSMSANESDDLYTSYFYNFRSLENLDKDYQLKLRYYDSISRVLYGKTILDEDFKSTESTGKLYAIPLPEGKYEFYKIGTVRADGMTESVWSNATPFSRRFNIKSGEITYFGDVHFRTTKGKNIFGMSVYSSPDIQIENSKQRDIPLLKNKYPDLNWNKISIVP